MKTNSITIPAVHPVPAPHAISESEESTHLLGANRVRLDSEGGKQGLWKRLWASPTASHIIIGAGCLCFMGASAGISYLTTHDLVAAGVIVLAEASVITCIGNCFIRRQERQIESIQLGGSGETPSWILEDIVPGIAWVRQIRELRRIQRTMRENEAGHDAFLKHISAAKEQSRNAKRAETQSQMVAENSGPESPSMQGFPTGNVGV